MAPAACVRYGTGTLDQACPFQCQTMMPYEAVAVVSPISTQASRAENAWMDALPITVRAATAGGNRGNRSVRQLLPFQCAAAHTSPVPGRGPTVQMSSGATAEAACGTSGEGTGSHRRPVNRTT